MMKNQPQRVLKAFQLTMMGVAAIFAIRSLSMTAIYGEASITYYIFGALLFLIPSALVCAELATTWPSSGGLYSWVRLAYGKRLGFLAIWLEWTNTIVAFPAMITFVIFTLIYPFAHVIVENKLFEFLAFLVVLWGLTIINFFGIKTSSWFTTLCVIVGVFIPVLLIIGLGIFWVASGKPANIEFTWAGLIPHLHFANIAFLVVIINSFSGIQIIAFHANHTAQPEVTYKKAMFSIVMILLGLAILGTLSMCIVLPQASLSLIGGLIQSFQIFLSSFHLAWLMPLIAVMVGIGVLSEINAWLIGPSKGLLTSTETGFLPEFLKKTNHKGMPVGVLTLQAIISSVLGMAYLLMSNINSAYWLLSDLTAQFTLLMWLLMFSGFIVLQFKYKDVPRPFKVPGKLFGAIVIPTIGWITCLCIFIAGFFPPTDVIHHNQIVLFESVLIGGLVIFSIIPFCLRSKNNDSMNGSVSVD